MIKARTAKFQIGQIVRHRVFSFRGVIFDIDPEMVRALDDDRKAKGSQ